jgi:hypothetical protein
MTTSKEYNGHKNWNHWNVSLWIDNDVGLYRMACRYARRSRHQRDNARHMLAELARSGITHTPDGAPYSISAIYETLKDF